MSAQHRPGVQRYRTPSGRPTCCRQMQAGLVCPHFEQINGYHDVCAALDQAPIERTDYSRGEWTIPRADCQVWEGAA